LLGKSIRSKTTPCLRLKEPENPPSLNSTVPRLKHTAMADPPSDMFVKKAQFTKTVYRDVYPTVYRTYFFGPYPELLFTLGREEFTASGSTSPEETCC
jgi:hypothetical protein